MSHCTWKQAKQLGAWEWRSWRPALAGELLSPRRLSIQSDTDGLMADLFFLGMVSLLSCAYQFILCNVYCTPG